MIDPNGEWEAVNVCHPEGVEAGHFKPVNSCLNVTESFPATCIAQGMVDTFVLLQAPQGLVKKIRDIRVRTQLIVIPGAEHMFTATMKLGNST